MSFVSLFLDRAFPDFNFCETLDPDLRPGGGPPQLALIQMVHAARRGDRSARREFTDTMFWTLRPESFECFQRVYGPRAISYRDWFYAKLSQFLDILAYEKLALDGFGPDGKARTPETDKPWEEGLTVLGPGGPGADPTDIEKTFVPADNAPVFWGEIVDEVCRAAGDRLAALEGIMGRLRRKRGRVASVEPGAGLPAGVRPRREWGLTRKRNQIIRQLLAEGKDGQEICAALDARGVAVLPIMKRRGVDTYVAGWAIKDLRRNVQQLFAKHRPKP
ncbi:MAG: hypothetical protein M1541_08290 [Acidobacteria bacterium]|nr:hypothetical protein [Acidobacteriota bacterium]